MSLSQIDLSTLSLQELLTLQQSLPAEIRRKQSSARAEALRAVRETARAQGFALEDLIGAQPAAKAAQPKIAVAIKYRNPNDHTLTWTGRGRKPKWVESWIENGGSMDELTIPVAN